MARKRPAHDTVFFCYIIVNLYPPVSCILILVVSCRCILSPSRQLKIVDLKLSKSVVLFVTNDGEVYTGEVKPCKRKANEIKPLKGRRSKMSPPIFSNVTPISIRSVTCSGFGNFLIDKIGSSYS